MRSGDQLPCIGQHATIAEAILEITRTRCGGVGVVDNDDHLVGAFTDGDLRRALGRAGIQAPVADHMSRSPTFVEPGASASEAVRLMNERDRPILLIFAVENGRLVGAAHMHDLLRAGVA